MDLRTFPLAWRWTNEKYAVLPDDALANIVPQSVGEANELFEASLGFLGKDGLDERQFDIVQVLAEVGSVEEVRKWLASCHLSEDTKVFLSWQPDTAVVTLWGIFVTHWNEFCYPASDDLVIWSREQSWAFLYHHEEFFQFGQRRGV